VIYLGNQMPEAVVQSAIQEDPDVVGLSTLSGNHMILAPMVVEGLRSNGLTDTPVVLGGTIPREDVPILMKKGIAGVFGPGSFLKDIVDFITRCSCRETKAGQGSSAEPAYETAEAEKEG